MKHGKKLFSTLALALCATTFISCGGANEKVTFKEYWFEDANVTPATVMETLSYDVEFKKSSGLSTNGYIVDYKNGEYTTKLTLTGDVYRYETSLTIDAVFTVGNQTVEKSDSILSWVEFKKTAKLQPIASHKEIVNHSPSNGGTTIETCFIPCDYTVDTTYNSDGLGGKTVIVNNKNEAKQEKTFNVEDKYTYLDNEQLLFAIRGLSQSTATATLSVYAPFSSVVQNISLQYSALKKGTEFTFQKGEEKIKKVINYYPVSVKINAQLPGATQTVWIAETGNASANTFRNVILQWETPLSYNLGSLIYKLKSANFI